MNPKCIFKNSSNRNWNWLANNQDYVVDSFKSLLFFYFLIKVVSKWGNYLLAYLFFYEEFKLSSQWNVIWSLIQKHTCFQNYQIIFLAILGSLHVLYQVWFKIICSVPMQLNPKVWKEAIRFKRYLSSMYFFKRWGSVYEGGG